MMRDPSSSRTEGCCRGSREVSAQSPTDIGLDVCECAILDVSRHFFCAYTETEVPHWERALKLAVDHFRTEDGPAIAISVLNVLSAMRSTRRNVFRFNSPYCPKCKKKITASECNLMRSIHFARRSQRSVGEMEALILCEGHSADRLMLAIDQLIAFLPTPMEGSAINERASLH